MEEIDTEIRQDDSEEFVVSCGTAVAFKNNNPTDTDAEYLYRIGCVSKTLSKTVEYCSISPNEIHAVLETFYTIQRASNLEERNNMAAAYDDIYDCIVYVNALERSAEMESYKDRLSELKENDRYCLNPPDFVTLEK